MRRHKINAVAVDSYNSSKKYGNIVTKAPAKIPRFYIEMAEQKVR